MSLVTPFNVSNRKGWKTTTMGRMVRPLRMRPERPLPPQAGPAFQRRTLVKAARKDGKEKATKKRAREPATRARRRTIDPTKWDSVHLKGMFLDVVTAGRVIREEQTDGDLGAGVRDGNIQSSGSESDNNIDEGNDPTST